MYIGDKNRRFSIHALFGSTYPFSSTGYLGVLPELFTFLLVGICTIYWFFSLCIFILRWVHYFLELRCMIQDIE